MDDLDCLAWVIVLIVIMWPIPIWLSARRERQKCFQAMVKALSQCPEPYKEGAAWLSSTWRGELRNLGIDLEKR